MVRVSSSKKKKDVENGGEKLNPEAIERRRLKTLAFSNNIISETPAKPRQPLTPSKLVIKNHGKDIVKKSQRKNRFLFSFPGLIAPIGGGKIGDLKDLGTKNPVLYLDFPQGRMKLFGTIVYPKNRYLTLQFPRGGKSVMCEDYFDNMIVFSDAWWIGKQADNPEEAWLDFPKELSDVQQAEYGFKGGAGGACISNKQDSQKTGISRVEEQSPKAKLEDDLSEDENKDLMKVTPTRQSTRTSGKAFKFVEVSSGDDSIQSDADVSEGEDKNDVAVDSSAGNHAGIQAGNLFSAFEIDDKEDVKASVAQSKRPSLSSTKKIKSNEDSCKNQGPLVQATISTLFKKVEEKTVRKSPRKLPSPKASGQKAQNTNLKRKIIQDEVPKKKPKVISEKSAGAKGKAKKKESKVEEDEDEDENENEDDIEEFSSASQDSDESDEDWAA
ncbi:hypothetical protein UlMin_009084 [Ulmus minor]